MQSLMKWLANLLESPKGLRNILLFKLIAAVAILLFFKQELFVGEVSSSAADEPTPATAVKDPKIPSTESSGKSDGSAASKEKNDKEDAPKRVSFLEDLLNLPKLNPDAMKKESLGRYLTLAEKKKQQLEERLSILKTREEQLVKIEKSIDEKLQRMDDERRFFAQGIQKEKELKGKRVERLIELYAKMEPRKASPIIEKLDKDLVVEILKQVDKKQAKSILEAMDPQKAVELTEYFGRVRSAREYDMLKELNMSLRKEFQDCRGMPQEQNDEDKATKPKNETGATAAPDDKATADAKTKKEEGDSANANPAADAAKTAPKLADAGKPEAPAAEKDKAEPAKADSPSAEKPDAAKAPASPADAKEKPPVEPQNNASQPKEETKS